MRTMEVGGWNSFEDCNQRPRTGATAFNASQRMYAAERHRDMRATPNSVASICVLATGLVFAGTGVSAGPTFDAASVKVTGAASPQTTFAGGPRTDDPGRLSMHVNMSSLLRAAFGARVDQIQGPAWLRNFSAMPFSQIVATMPASSTKAQVEIMLQNLLVERFRLVYHRGTRYAPGYELVVDESGPKVQEGTTDAPSSNVPVLMGFRLFRVLGNWDRRR
jgi:hypothetical protein